VRDGIGAEADIAWQERWNSSRRSNKQKNTNTSEQAVSEKQQQQQELGQRQNLSRSVNYSRAVGESSFRCSSSSEESTTVLQREDTSSRTGIGNDLPSPAAAGPICRPRLSPRRGFSIAGKDTSAAR
jgi:hypothetical protein